MKKILSTFALVCMATWMAWGQAVQEEEGIEGISGALGGLSFLASIAWFFVELYRYDGSAYAKRRFKCVACLLVASILLFTVDTMFG